MISHKHKCIFLHAPKTGGTSIEKALTGRDWWFHGLRPFKHMEALDAREKYRKYWDDYFKFSIVRNPWSRAVSWYHYHQLGENKKISFGQWVRDGCPIYHIPKHLKLSGKLNPYKLTQQELLSDKSGKILVDYVGRFENLAGSYRHVCSILEKNCKLTARNRKLPHTLKSNHKKYTEYYTPELLEYTQEWAVPDCEAFGYTYGV